MTKLTCKSMALAAAVLSLAAASVRASAVAPNWKALEEADPVDDAPLKAPRGKMLEKPAPANGTPAAETVAAAPASAAGANPLARGATPNVTGAAAAPGTAGPKDDATTPPARTPADPWNGLQNTGPAPMFNNPAPCAMTPDAFSPNEPKCPPGYTPGQHELMCGKNSTRVDLAGSVVCVDNTIGMDQLNGAITPGDRSQVQAFLVSRGLPESAAAFAVNALNAPNLKGFACSQWDFVAKQPMSAFGEISWNLMLFDYVYGSLDPLHKTSQPLPAFCSKTFH